MHPPTTPVTLFLRPCNSADIPALAAINHAAFDNPRNKVMYLDVSHQDKLKIFSDKAYLMVFHHDNANPEPFHRFIHYLCIVDSTTETIIANAVRYHFPRGYIPHLDVDAHHHTESLLPGTNKTLVQDFANLTAQSRSNPPRHTEPQWLLSLLVTDPTHQGKGAGTMLIDWGTRKADTMGVRCFVDASPAGLGLYRRLGFEKEVGELEVDLGRYKGGEEFGVQRWVA
ncbi:MAG: hypothetical protein Q9226_002545 [Calogaya cf. arnoldii]